MRHLPFCELLDRLGIGTTQVCDWLERSPKTVKRWRENDAPAWVKNALISMAGYHEFRTIGGSIEWWLFRDGVAYPPENVAFPYGEIRSLPLLHAQIRTLRAENERLKRERDGFAWAKQPANEAHIDQLTVDLFGQLTPTD